LSKQGTQLRTSLVSGTLGRLVKVHRVLLAHRTFRWCQLRIISGQDRFRTQQRPWPREHALPSSTVGAIKAMTSIPGAGQSLCRTRIVGQRFFSAHHQMISMISPEIPALSKTLVALALRFNLRQKRVAMSQRLVTSHPWHRRHHGQASRGVDHCQVPLLKDATSVERTSQQIMRYRPVPPNDALALDGSKIGGIFQY